MITICHCALLLFDAKTTDCDVVAAQCFAGFPIEDFRFVHRVNQRHYIENHFDVALRKKSAGLFKKSSMRSCSSVQSGTVRPARSGIIRPVQWAVMNSARSLLVASFFITLVARRAGISRGSSDRFRQAASRGKSRWTGWSWVVPSCSFKKNEAGRVDISCTYCAML